MHQQSAKWIAAELSGILDSVSLAMPSTPIGMEGRGGEEPQSGELILCIN